MAGRAILPVEQLTGCLRRTSLGLTSCDKWDRQSPPLSRLQVLSWHFQMCQRGILRCIVDVTTIKALFLHMVPCHRRPPPYSNEIFKEPSETIKCTGNPKPRGAAREIIDILENCLQTSRLVIDHIDCRQLRQMGGEAWLTARKNFLLGSLNGLHSWRLAVVIRSDGSPLEDRH